MITIRLFGKFEICDADGHPITVPGPKTQGLLAFLAMTTELPPRRDRLISLFWGDRFSEQARQSLRQAIAKLRRILPSDGPDLFIVDQDRIGLNPRAVDVDFDRFCRLSGSDTADEVFEAVSVLRGPLLDGLFGQQPAFEDWIASERQRLNELAAKVLERASAAAMARGDVETALAHAKHLIQIDPWSDAAQIVLLRLLAQTGNRARAIQAFNTYQDALRAELGISAGRDLLDLVEQIRGEGGGQAVISAPVPPHPAPEAPAKRTSIAFVPFAGLTNHPDQGFLAAGLTDDLSTKLSCFGWLDLYASGDAPGQRLSADEMRVRYADQGIKYLVNGALRSQATRHRLTLQVTDTRTGRYVWVDRFDRESENSFALQDDLSDTAVGALECALERLEGRKVRDKGLMEMNAWEAYHRGVDLSAAFDAHANAEAQRCFHRAIALDPNFALAHARLAHAIVMATIYHEADSVRQLLDTARSHAQEAVKLDPEDAFVQFAMGRVLMCGGQYDQAIAKMEKSIALNPNHASAYCGIADSLTYAGDHTAAQPLFEQALAVTPCDAERWTLLKFGAAAKLFCAEYDTAEDWATQAETVPLATYWPTALRTAALAHRGKLKEAKSAVSQLLSLRPGLTCDFVKSRLFYLKDPAQVDIYVSGLRKAGLA